MFCYLKDDEHGIFTEMCTMMQQAVVTLPTVYLFDTRLRGWIHRERGITFFESPAVRAVLPAWVVQASAPDVLRPQALSWMDLVGEVQHTIRQGVFRFCSDDHDRDAGMESQVPMVIGCAVGRPPDICSKRTSAFT